MPKLQIKALIYFLYPTFAEINAAIGIASGFENTNNNNVSTSDSSSSQTSVEDPGVGTLAADAEDTLDYNNVVTLHDGKYTTSDGTYTEYTTVEGSYTDYTTFDGAFMQYTTVDGSYTDYTTIDGALLQYTTVDGTQTSYSTFDGQLLQYYTTFDGTYTEYTAIDGGDRTYSTYVQSTEIEATTYVNNDQEVTITDIDSQRTVFETFNYPMQQSTFTTTETVLQFTTTDDSVLEWYDTSTEYRTFDHLARETEYLRLVDGIIAGHTIINNDNRISEESTFRGTYSEYTTVDNAAGESTYITIDDEAIEYTTYSNNGAATEYVTIDEFGTRETAFDNQGYQYTITNSMVTVSATISYNRGNTYSTTCDLATLYVTQVPSFGNITTAIAGSITLETTSNYNSVTMKTLGTSNNVETLFATYLPVSVDWGPATYLSTYGDSLEIQKVDVKT